MRFYLFILLLLSYSTAASQKDTSQFEPHWSIGMSGGVVNYAIDADIHPAFDHTFSHDAVGLQGGFDLSFNASKGMRISTGLHFFDVFYEFDYVWIAIDPNDPFIPIEKRTSIKMADVPMSLSVDIVRGNRSGLYALVGGAASFQRKVQQTITYGDGRIEETDNTLKLVPNAFFGLGIKYSVGERTDLWVESRLRGFTKGFDPDLNEDPTSLSFSLGIASRIDWKCIFKGDAWRPIARCD